MTEPDPGAREGLRGELWVLAAAILWGTTGTAQAFAPDGAQPATVGTLRLLLGSLALLTFAVIQKSFDRERPWPLGQTALSAICIAAYQIFFFTSVQITGVAIGTMVAIGSAPILAGILAWRIRQEVLTRRWVISTILAISGCIILIISTDSESVFRLYGVILAFGAGLSYAGYSLTSKQILKDQAPEAVAAVVFTLGSIILLPILFFSRFDWLTKANGAVIIIHLGLVATALAYILFNRGLKQIPVSTAVTLSLAEPLTAALLGIFFLQERYTWASQAGMLLLFIGLATLAIHPETISARWRLNSQK